MRKHSRHHANPNKVGADEDIRPGVLLFTPDDAARRTGLSGWLTARQGWLFFPLLTLEGLSLHADAVRTVVQDRELSHRGTEALLLTIRLAVLPGLVLALLGPGLGAAFLAVQLAVFGVYMGATFAPNHKGMPLVPRGTRIDFLSRQVLTSRNIRGGRPWTGSWAASTCRSSSTCSRACQAATCAGRRSSAPTAPSTASPTPRPGCSSPMASSCGTSTGWGWVTGTRSPARS